MFKGSCSPYSPTPTNTAGAFPFPIKSFGFWCPGKRPRLSGNFHDLREKEVTGRASCLPLFIQMAKAISHKGGLRAPFPLMTKAKRGVWMMIAFIVLSTVLFRFKFMHGFAVLRDLLLQLRR